MKRLLYTAVMLLCLSGCADRLPTAEAPEGGLPSAGLMAKAVNTMEDAVSGSLLIYVSEDVASSLEGDDYYMDSLAVTWGVSSIRRLFPAVEKTESRTRAYGLHRWYEVFFPEDSDVTDMALMFSEKEYVQRIQFNNRMKKASDCISRQYVPSSSRMSVRASSFNDPYLKDQWHYMNSGNVVPSAVAGADVNVADAWRLTGGDPSIVVAVIDEGVQYDHPDLAGNMWVNEDEIKNGSDSDGNGYRDDIHGYNFAGRGELSWARAGDSGHGTHVAGTVAAVNNNGKGVAGIAGGTGNRDGVKIMSCQIFDGHTGGSDSVIAAAVKYAADNGACIAQCSFGVNAGWAASDGMYKKNMSAEYEAFRYFIETSNCPDVLEGGLVIFAAGNEHTGIAAYPGACREFISVTSFAADYLPAYYTNYGPGCNIAAPGGEYYTGSTYYDETAVLSTMPTEKIPQYDANGNFYEYSAVNYGYMQGTSMACPHVSGVAALALSYAKKTGRRFYNDEMVSMILTSVNDIDSRLSGSKRTLLFNSSGEGYIGSMALAPFRYKMGTGAIDAWKLLVSVEGIPSFTVLAGGELVVDLEELFGGGASHLKYLGVEISDKDKASIGLNEAPLIQSGRLFIYPTKRGAAKITINAVAGGNMVGSDENTGGMKISKEISVLSRNIASSNGGWL